MKLTPQTTTLIDKYEIIQLNLHKSRTATNDLIAHMLNNNVAIALIQEAFVCRHGPRYKVSHLNGLQLAAHTSQKFLSAIIYNKDAVSSLFIPQLSNDHFTVISVQLGKTQAFFASIYLPPSSDIRTEIKSWSRNSQCRLKL
jgi:hypothetical protein